jgi:AcrR family transcriptional regulator
MDAAWALITRDGVAAVSMRELASHAGMRPQSISEHFPSRAALPDALFRDSFSNTTRRLSQLPLRGPDNSSSPASMTS